MCSRELTAVELVQSALERIESTDALTRSFVHVDAEHALARAAELDMALSRGAEPGPLFGVPVSVKDLFHVAGMPTSAGSLLFKDVVATEDSIHASRLRVADAIIVGKTNTPEFGVYPRTVNLVQPETVNPWDLSRTSGGSSGGAAASVAAGLTAIAVGSDGGGSIRIPAALCGVSGLLPTRGLVPRHGGIGGTRLFSSVGPIATTARDLATLLQALAGPSRLDPLARADDPPDLLESLEAGVRGVTIAQLESTGVAEPDAGVLDAVTSGIDILVDAGASRRRTVTLDAAAWQEGFYAMMAADRYATIGEQVCSDPAAEERLSDYGRQAFERGRAVTGAQYSRALEMRYAARQTVLDLFEAVDLLVSPTTSIVAPPTVEERDPGTLVGFTNFCNLVGAPAGTVPCGLVDGLPVGLQIVGRPGADALVLRALRAVERAVRLPRPSVTHE